MAISRCAIIKNGVVVNVVVADVSTYVPGSGEIIRESNSADIGDSFDGVNFISTKPPAVEETTSQLYDRELSGHRLLKVVVLCLNDGTLPIGQNLTAAQIKNIIRAKFNGS